MLKSKSLQDFKIEIDNLKHNLLKEKDSCNCSGESLTRSVIRDMLYMKKTNNFLGNEILIKKKKILQKEKFILQLLNELNFHLKDNSFLKSELNTIIELKHQCEINVKGVTDYCCNLKSKYKSDLQLINKYEDNISELKIQRENIINSSESIIKMKCK